MTALLDAVQPDFVKPGVSALVAPLDPAHEAHEPPEVRGSGRDDVRLLCPRATDRVTHAVFDALPRFLRAGDAVVVNNSATVPAAVAAVLPDNSPNGSPTAPRSGSTSRRSCPAASGSSSPAASTARRPHRSRATR